MKALATLENVDSESCKRIIARNLSRILEIRIIDIDIENGILHFLYNGQKAFDQVKKELSRIGHPIQNCTEGLPTNLESEAGNDLSSSQRSFHKTKRTYGRIISP